MQARPARAASEPRARRWQFLPIPALARQILRRIETDFGDPELSPEGLATELGRIATRIREVGATATPLQLRMKRFAQLIGLVVAAGGWVIALAGESLVAATGLRAGFVGGVLMGLINALPEAITAIAAVRRGAVTLAVAAVLGGVLFALAGLYFVRYAVESGAYARDHFFGPDPRLRRMVAEPRPVFTRASRADATMYSCSAMRSGNGASPAEAPVERSGGSPVSRQPVHEATTATVPEPPAHDVEFGCGLGRLVRGVVVVRVIGGMRAADGRSHGFDNDRRFHA